MIYIKQRSPKLNSSVTLVLDINVMKDQCDVRVCMLTVLIKCDNFNVITGHFSSSACSSTFEWGAHLTQ